MPAEPERIIITAGAQHSVSTILTALTTPGDTITTEAMTYPGFKAAAQLRHLRVEGIAVDQEGLLPEAFAAACRATPIRLLYCSPNLCNPLAGVLSLVNGAWRSSRSRAAMTCCWSRMTSTAS